MPKGGGIVAIEAGSVVSELILDGQKYFSTLAQADKQTKSFADKMSSAGKKVEGVGKKMFLGVTVPIVAAGVAAFKLASDMEEAINKVDVAFKDNSKEVKAWSANTLKNFGIAKGSALDMAALFGDMGTSMGLPTKEAAVMSTSLVGLAGDLASFKNIGIDRAMTALNGIFTGEGEALKGLGVVMTVTNLEAFALTKGIKKQYKEMSQAEQVNLRYAYVMDKTKNAQGDFARTQDGAANQMRIFTESLKELGATFGANILPVITPVIQKVNDLIQEFGALDKGTQQTIIKVAAFAALAGPVLIGTGKMITGIGSVVGLFSKLAGGATIASGALGATGTAAGLAGAGATGLAGGLGAALLAVAPFVLGVAAIGGAALIVHDQMNNDLIPTVDLYADSMTDAGLKTTMSLAEQNAALAAHTTVISAETKKAVGSYMEMSNGVMSELTNLYVTSAALTDESVASLTGKFQAMGATVIAGQQANHEARYNDMVTFFANSSALTEAEEAQALADMVTNNETAKAETNKHTEEILAIINREYKEHGEITATGQAEIKALNDQGNLDATTALARTEAEAKVIRDRLTGYGTRMTAELASKEIENANKARDGQIKAAEKTYVDTCANIAYMRDVSGSITDEQATSMLEDAERAKKGSIDKAEEMRSGVVNKLEQMYPDVMAKVDSTTGAILDSWGKVKKWWDSWHPDKKEFSSTSTQTTIEKRVPSVDKYKPNKPVGHWKGTSNFHGGLTEINERGYEVIDLPGGSRIYPHEASKDIMKGMGNSGGGDYYFEIPVVIDGRQIAKAAAKFTSQELAKLESETGRGGQY